MLDLLTNAGASLASLRYNYNEIAADHRATVRDAALDIRQRTKRASEDILAIGRKLCEVKDLLPHGQFTDWVSEEFDLTIRTAQRMMAVAERFDGKNGTVTHLGTSVLYLLAAPSTPDAAIDAVVEYAQANGVPTKTEVQAIIADHKPARTLNDQETEVVVWRAIKHSGVNGPSAQVAWLFDTDMATYAPMLAPGVVLDYQVLHRALQSVRSQLAQMAARIQPDDEPMLPANMIHFKEISRLSAVLIAHGWGIMYAPMPLPCDVHKGAVKFVFSNRNDKLGELSALRHAMAHEESANAIETSPSPLQPTERPQTPPPPPTPQAAPIVAVVDEDSGDEDNDGFYISESDEKRNSKIDNLLGIYKLVLSTLPQFEALTGCYSHAGQLRRAIDAAAEDLERNRTW